MTLKLCNRCKKEKDIKDFHKNRTRKDGRDTWCAKCSNEYNKRYYSSNSNHNKELKKIRSKRYKKALRIKAKNSVYTYLKLVAGAGYLKIGVRKKLLELYLNSPYCHYCGIKFNNHTCIHIEHKTPISRGGKSTIDNLVFSCKECNMCKGTMTEEEFISFLKGYVKRVSKKLNLDDRGEPKGR